MPARILVVLGHSLHVRNFVASGCLDRLVAHGHDLTVLMLRGLIQEVRRWGGVRLTDALEPIEPYLAGRSVAWLRRRFRIASFAQRRRFRTYRHKLQLGAASSPWYALEARLFSALATRFDLEALARRIEVRLAPRREAMELLERVRPDLVFCPTIVHDGSEVELLKAARLRGVPTVAFAASWDTLTSKGFFLGSPDYLLVWGEESLRHAVEFHGFPPERVIATGAPHFDVYGPGGAVEPRERFLARRGIDPSKRVMLFAGATISKSEDEPAQVRALSEAVRTGELKDCVIWYRPHPYRGRSLEDVQALGELRGVYVDDQFVRQKTTEASPFSTRPEDLRHYRGLLDASEGVIAAFSTMIIEAAMLGKPSLVIAFGLNDGTRLLQHSEYEHMADVVATTGVTVCRSLEELKHGVQRVCAGDYAPLAPALRARAGQISRNLDGRAQERIVEALERVLARGAP